MSTPFRTGMTVRFRPRREPILSRLPASCNTAAVSGNNQSEPLRAPTRVSPLRP